MVLWEDSFRLGVAAFRSSNYKKALSCFDEAVKQGGERHIVYDSRAATYEKIGKTKQALKDSRKVIELAPHTRQGYVRSARLFLKLGTYDTALDILQLAFDRVEFRDATHRVELEAMKQTVLDAKNAQIISEAQKKPHVLKLPVELVSEIFILAMEVDITAPVCVALVCSRWRSIALSTPALWRRILLSNAHPVRKMGKWLERSQERITRLHIRTGISKLQLEDTLTKYGPKIFETLKYIHCEVDLLPFLCLLGTFPKALDLDLEDIRVLIPRQKRLREIHDGLPTPLAPLVPLTCANNVRSLVLEHVTLDWQSVLPLFSCLRTLIIKGSCILPTTALMAALFVSNPHLECMALETEDPWLWAQGTPTEGRIDLRNLSHLELLGSFETDKFLARLSLPALECLVMSQSSTAADKALSELEPPFPALTELSIHKCFFSEDALSTFLQQIPTLTKLEVTHTANRMDIIVDAVSGSKPTQDGQTNLVCPRLQHVDFSYSSNLNSGPIVRLVRIRLAALKEEAPSSISGKLERIKTIRIDGCLKVDPAVPEWLRTRVDKHSCVYMTKAELRKARVYD